MVKWIVRLVRDGLVWDQIKELPGLAEKLSVAAGALVAVIAGLLTNLPAGLISGAVVMGLGVLLTRQQRGPSRTPTKDELIDLGDYFAIGTSLRNEGAYQVTKRKLKDWIRRARMWEDETTRLIEGFSPADAAKVRTLNLRAVPLPSELGATVSLPGTRHDVELRCLHAKVCYVERMLDAYGVASGSIAPPPVPDAVVHVGLETIRSRDQTKVAAEALRAMATEAQVEPFATAPHLGWSGVTVAPYSERGYEGYELRVQCGNYGPKRAQVKVGTMVEAIAIHELSPGETREPIRFEDFSVPGDIRALSDGFVPFTLRMQCKRRAAHIDRKVTWRIIYTDDDDRLGYLTTCSAVVRWVLGKPSVVGEPELDQSSREARHEAYKKWRAEQP